MPSASVSSARAWPEARTPRSCSTSSFDFHDIDDPWAFPQIRHRVQLQDMVDAIREGHDPILSGDEARESLAIIMAIYESSRTGQEQFLSAPEYAPARPPDP